MIVLVECDTTLRPDVVKPFRHRFVAANERFGSCRSPEDIFGDSHSTPMRVVQFNLAAFPDCVVCAIPNLCRS